MVLYTTYFYDSTLNDRANFRTHERIEGQDFQVKGHRRFRLSFEEKHTGNAHEFSEVKKRQIKACIRAFGGEYCKYDGEILSWPEHSVNISQIQYLAK